MNEGLEIIVIARPDACTHREAEPDIVAGERAATSIRQVDKTHSSRAAVLLRAPGVLRRRGARYFASRNKHGSDGATD